MAQSVLPPRPGVNWSRERKTKIRALYLVQGLSPSEIAEKLGDVDSKQVRNLVQRQGWAKQRAEVQARLDQKEAAALEKVGADAAEFIQSVAAQSEEMAEAGFKLARDSASAYDAKGFAYAAQGVKTFVGLARQAQGLDSKGAAQVARHQTINVVFARHQAAKAEPVPVSASVVEDEDVDLDFGQSQQDQNEDEA